MMVVQDAAEKILVKYYTANAAIQIFAQNAKEGAGTLMGQNMPAAPDVVRKLTMTIQLLS